jgi:hypothetical protein
MTVPTGTSSPAASVCSTSVPADVDSISTVDFSVSISAMMSPRATVSPTFLTQAAIEPVSMS